MKVSAKIGVILAAIFAAICFSVALEGFVSLERLEGQVRSDALGFAGFWAFLGAVAVVFGALSAWIAKTHKEEDG